jgi:hypothetical protein
MKPIRFILPVCAPGDERHGDGPSQRVQQEAAAVDQFHHAHRRIRDCSRSASLSVSFIVGHVAESQVVDRICRITRPTRSQGDKKDRWGSTRPGACGTFKSYCERFRICQRRVEQSGERSPWGGHRRRASGHQILGLELLGMRVLQFLLIVLVLVGTASGEEQLPPTSPPPTTQEQPATKKALTPEQRLQQQVERLRRDLRSLHPLYCEAFRNGSWVPVPCWPE